ncbi:MAG: ankyrin repeat domain-containing protein [Parachlamydiales bacterium]
MELLKLQGYQTVVKQPEQAIGERPFDKVIGLFKRVILGLEKKPFSYPSDENGQTALHRNARNYENMSKLLAPLKDWVHQDFSGELAPWHKPINPAVHVRDQWGKTPLFYADPEWRSADLLFKKGALPNAKDNEGKTLLHHQPAQGVMEKAIWAGANVNEPDNLGRTPLHYAIDDSMARFLVNHGANVHAKDRLGQTPLHLADDEDTAEVLIQGGAKLSATNSMGQTAEEVLIASLGSKIVEQLKRH